MVASTGWRMRAADGSMACPETEPESSCERAKVVAASRTVRILDADFMGGLVFVFPGGWGLQKSFQNDLNGL